MVVPQISAFPMGIPLFPYQTYQSFKRELRAQIAEGGSFENSSLLGKCILLAALVFTLLSMLLKSAQTAAWQVSCPLPPRNVLKLEKIRTFFSSMNVCSILHSSKPHQLRKKVSAHYKGRVIETILTPQLSFFWQLYQVGNGRGQGRTLHPDHTAKRSGYCSQQALQSWEPDWPLPFPSPLRTDIRKDKMSQKRLYLPYLSHLTTSSFLVCCF